MKKFLICILSVLGFSLLAQAKPLKHSFEVEAAKLIGSASKAPDSKASGGYVVCLTKYGEGVKLFNIKASNKLAICYASVSVGTISVVVNNQLAHKVNIHSSGALMGSFLYSIIDIAIPNNASLTISLAHDDAVVNIDKIIVGEAVYGSRPFEVFGDNTVLYTRNLGNIYATLLNWDGNSVTLSALHTGGATLGKVSKVEILGSDRPLKFIQDDKGLTIKPEEPLQRLPGITDQSLASRCRVMRITHDKGWFNDDDPGVKALGWLRKCNLGTGDFNNDLTTSDTPGDTWTCSFIGNNISVIAPKEAGAGKIEVLIDGKTCATADLSIIGTRKAQQVVCEISGITPGEHTVSIINIGSGPVAVDALIVR